MSATPKKPRSARPEIKMTKAAQLRQKPTQHHEKKKVKAGLPSEPGVLKRTDSSSSSLAPAPRALGSRNGLSTLSMNSLGSRDGSLHSLNTSTSSLNRDSLNGSPRPRRKPQSPVSAEAVISRLYKAPPSDKIKSNFLRKSDRSLPDVVRRARPKPSEEMSKPTITETPQMEEVVDTQPPVEEVIETLPPVEAIVEPPKRKMVNWLKNKAKSWENVNGVPKWENVKKCRSIPDMSKTEYDSEILNGYDSDGKRFLQFYFNETESWLTPKIEAYLTSRNIGPKLPCSSNEERFVEVEERTSFFQPCWLVRRLRSVDDVDAYVDMIDMPCGEVSLQEFEGYIIEKDRQTPPKHVVAHIGIQTDKYRKDKGTSPYKPVMFSKLTQTDSNNNTISVSTDDTARPYLSRFNAYPRRYSATSSDYSNLAYHLSTYTDRYVSPYNRYKHLITYSDGHNMIGRDAYKPPLRPTFYSSTETLQSSSDSGAKHSTQLPVNKTTSEYSVNNGTQENVVNSVSEYMVKPASAYAVSSGVRQTPSCTDHTPKSGGTEIVEQMTKSNASGQTFIGFDFPDQIKPNTQYSFKINTIEHSVDTDDTDHTPKRETEVMEHMSKSSAPGKTFNGFDFPDKIEPNTQYSFKINTMEHSMNTVDDDNGDFFKPTKSSVGTATEAPIPTIHVEAWTSRGTDTTDMPEKPKKKSTSTAATSTQDLCDYLSDSSITPRASPVSVVEEELESSSAYGSLSSAHRSIIDRINSIKTNVPKMGLLNQTVSKSEMTDDEASQIHSELNRLASERIEIIELLALNIMNLPSSLTVELLEAKLNYSLGQTDQLLAMLKDSWDVESRSNYNKELIRITQEIIQQSRAELDNSKRAIHMCLDEVRFVKGGGRGTNKYLNKEIMKMKRRAEIEAFKLERMWEQLHHERRQKREGYFRSYTNRGRRSPSPAVDTMENYVNYLSDLRHRSLLAASDDELHSLRSQTYSDYDNWDSCSIGSTSSRVSLTSPRQHKDHLVDLRRRIVSESEPRLSYQSEPRLSYQSDPRSSYQSEPRATYQSQSRHKYTSLGLPSRSVSDISRDPPTPSWTSLNIGRSARPGTTSSSHLSATRKSTVYRSTIRPSSSVSHRDLLSPSRPSYRSAGRYSAK